MKLRTHILTNQVIIVSDSELQELLTEWVDMVLEENIPKDAFIKALVMLFPDVQTHTVTNQSLSLDSLRCSLMSNQNGTGSSGPGGSAPSSPPSYPMNTDNAEDVLENVLEVELVRALIATEGRFDSKQERATAIFKNIRKQRETKPLPKPEIP